MRKRREGSEDAILSSGCGAFCRVTGGLEATMSNNKNKVRVMMSAADGGFSVILRVGATLELFWKRDEHH